ncbi:uncharacterized protein JCM6883_007640 [Sporobolomyces salmoneus]|uniref:uncharacterized protein n=1 Tax=Sporobolomyces salmoneus TaxID=183962 RepID=UPI0031782D71
MNPTGLLRASKIRVRLRTIQARKPSSTTYSTLAPSRSTRPFPPSTTLMNPSLFLFHVSSLSIASCFIPLIGARQASTTIREEPPVELESLRPEYPIQQPYPTRNQLLKLSSQLRKQIKAAPLDAAFTLRQLHLVNSLPRLHLPDCPSTDLSTLLPERWIWRLPATAALHSIFRLLRDPKLSKDSRISEALLPIALIIARHALEFDTVMWATILRAQGQGSALEWERLLLRARGQAGGEGLEEDTAIMTRLDTTERDRRIESQEYHLAEGEKRHDALVRRLWGKGFAEEMERTSRPAPLSSRLRMRKQAKLGQEGEEDGNDNRPLPSHLRSFSSIPARTLDELVIFLSQRHQQNPEIVSSTLAISLSLSNLRVPRSRRALYHSFETSLDHNRPDLAARFFADYLDQVERNKGEGSDQAGRMLKQRLAPILRPTDRSFDPSPSREVLSAVATLARTLDQQWTRLTSSRSRDKPPAALSDLLRLLASFPVAAYSHDLESGTEEYRLARQHARVYKMVKHVLRRILETLVGRTIHLGSVNSFLGQPFKTNSRKLPLNVYDFNTLIDYSLTKFQSAELALLVLERMTKQGLSPTPATHNIVFSILSSSSPEPPSYLETLDRYGSSRLKDSRTIPTLLAHMSRTSNFDELEQIVFRLLPELDHRSLPPSLLPPTPLTPSPPPSTGRNPYLYTTLLHALACAGRVGLAERVFRNGRWAAELSRSHAAESQTQEGEEGGGGSPQSRSKGWVLPPHAFTIMLQLYASQVKRGRQLERRLDPSYRHSLLPSSSSTSSSPAGQGVHVCGWGRHALRVFLLRSAQANSPHPPSSTSSIPETRLHSKYSRFPPFLRSEAAPIVALYELEGGSKPEELKSLELAMKDERTREALEVLFPGSTTNQAQGLGLGEGKRRRKQKRDERDERRVVRSERDKRRAREGRMRERVEREMRY